MPVNKMVRQMGVDRRKVLRRSVHEAALPTLIIINYYVKIHDIRPVLFTVKCNLICSIIHRS